MKKVSEQTVLMLISLYESGKTIKEISKETLIPKSSIQRYLSNKVQIRQYRKYQYNPFIFKQIDSHEKAYWIGFLMADGCITSNNILALSLKSSDIDHIKKFKQFIESEHPIKTYSRECKFTSKISTIEYSTLFFAATDMIPYLNKLGIIPNKTFHESIPNIEDRFLNSFILGFFDGDGSWIKDHDKNHHEFYHFKLIGNLEFVTNIQRILVNNLTLRENKIFASKTDKPIYTLKWGGNKNIKKIAQFLYANSPIFLERKKNIINHLL